MKIIVMSTGIDKFVHLLTLLKHYNKLAIAFSGGVDSTLLLYAAQTALGPENVMAVHLTSTLQSKAVLIETRKTFVQNFPQLTKLHEISVDPLEWEDFITNDSERCYHCKKKMYTYFQNSMRDAGYSILADGTNCDDLLEMRPGLRAIRELQVVTPLADAGCTKLDVRQLAEKFFLSNFALPSNSCLATRIPHNTPITEKQLRLIEKAELFLHNIGFLGCRVKIYSSYTVIEVQEKDLAAFVDTNNRKRIQSYFDNLQLSPISLSLKGR